MVPKVIRGAKNAPPPGRKSLFFHPVKIGLTLKGFAFLRVVHTLAIALTFSRPVDKVGSQDSY